MRRGGGDLMGWVWCIAGGEVGITHTHTHTHPLHPHHTPHQHAFPRGPIQVTLDARISQLSHVPCQHTFSCPWMIPNGRTHVHNNWTVNYIYTYIYNSSRVVSRLLKTHYPYSSLYTCTPSANKIELILEGKARCRHRESSKE